MRFCMCASTRLITFGLAAVLAGVFLMLGAGLVETGGVVCAAGAAAGLAAGGAGGLDAGGAAGLGTAALARGSSGAESLVSQTAHSVMPGSTTQPQLMLGHNE
eukprot:5039343-Prymnesium_polylepis.1